MTKKQMLERMREEIYFGMDNWNYFSEIEYDETRDETERKSASDIAYGYHREAMTLNKLCIEFFNVDAVNEWLDL